MNRLLLLLAGFSIMGCGGSDEPTLYQLSGEVEFDGQPIPYGRVEFEPDTTKGNSGGPGYADIVDGKYDTNTPTGRGVVGGPHIVRFYGSNERPQTAGADGTLDETAIGSIEEDGKGSKVAKDLPLVSGYEMAQELATDDGVVNFDLPAEASAAVTAASSAKRRQSAVPDP
ncbi:MAG: hypothetical protein KDA75_17990 [Planctomycetaceae bacterium]|nr:hypothetical protein [Planctomycetaceae bacterium]